MTEPSELGSRAAAAGGAVGTILLATDLTPRCDHATERAVELARLWAADLHVLTVLSPTPLMYDDGESEEALASRTRQMVRDRLGDCRAEVHVLIGPANEAIVSLAMQVQADLIVTGPSGVEFLGQTLLGGTVKGLLRAARVPVLLVKRKVVRAYRRVVVATDLSDASRAPIEAATRLFGRRVSMSVFHAFGTPFRMFVDEPDRYEAGVRNGVTLEIRQALKAWSIPEAETLPVIADRGDAATRLAELAEKHDIDLVVAGTHGRTGLMSVILGSVAKAIAETAGCDVLVVPSRGAWTE